MKNIFKNIFKKKNKNIVVLKKPRPNMCGGTHATQDVSAPKTIVSYKMTSFDVTSALGYVRDRDDLRDLGYFSAFAAPCGDGCFLYLQTASGRGRGYNKTSDIAYVKDDIFPSLVKLVNDCNLASGNGYHSKTSGLPENFGGSADIRYESGERISFSNNQSPIIMVQTAIKIVETFEEAMKGERIPLPDVSSLNMIKFEEMRKNGGYTKASITINGDGTAKKVKSARYDDPQVYENEYEVPAETVEKLKKIVEDYLMPAWAALPYSGYDHNSNKKITFVFDSGEEVTVLGDRLLPGQLHKGFFDIELEMTTSR